LKRILSDIGLEPERLQMVNMSSAMGAQFAQVSTEITNQIVQLGPNPLRSGRAGKLSEVQVEEQG
jgi:F420-non-reducing hydrogenase iron-sulfur subunit